MSPAPRWVCAFFLNTHRCSLGEECSLPLESHCSRHAPLHQSRLKQQQIRNSQTRGWRRSTNQNLVDGSVVSEALSLCGSSVVLYVGHTETGGHANDSPPHNLISITPLSVFPSHKLSNIPARGHLDLQSVTLTEKSSRFSNLRAGTWENMEFLIMAVLFSWRKGGGGDRVYCSLFFEPPVRYETFSTQIRTICLFSLLAWRWSH